MPSENIISRLSARLSGATSNNRTHPDPGTRHIGGSYRTNTPYISGYFQIMFELPDELFKGTDKDVAAKTLHSTCEAFNPPTTSD